MLNNFFLPSLILTTNISFVVSITLTPTSKGDMDNSTLNKNLDSNVYATLRGKRLEIQQCMLVRGREAATIGVALSYKRD